MFESIIAHHAKVRPDSLAIIDPRRTMTFRQFDNDIEVLRRLLGSQSFSGLVAILVTDPSDHWSCIFALARLGLATLSLSTSEAAGLEAQLDLASAAHVISDQPLTVGNAKVFALPSDWRTGSVTQEPAGRHVYDGAAITRVTTSSGSTGKPKLVGLTNDLLDLRIRNAPLLGPLTGGRLLSLIGVDNWAGFIGPLISWATSGSVIFPGRDARWLALLTTARPELMIVSPLHLAQIVQGLPRTFTPYGPLRIVVAGGALPPALSNLVRTMLTPDVFISYASTESGFSSYGNVASFATIPGAAGFVLPWSDVEIVDENDSELPAGTLGAVRTRGIEAVSNYYGDQNQQNDFRGGWFYPGDIGTVSQGGLLTILGRVSEVMNCAGIKIAPLPIEDALLRCRGVRDVAAVAVPHRDGFDHPYAAVVVDETFEPASAVEALKGLRHEVRVVVVDSIPRTSGLAKIRRDAVREKVLKQLASASRN